jgi:hypothetical protein
LSRRFLASPEVGALAVISKSFGLRFDFAQEDQLTLPAASVPELRAAAAQAPVPPAAPSSGAPAAPSSRETPTSASPAAPRTTGG